MLKIEVIGNLGATAETKTQNGETFVTMRIAATNKYANKETGEIIENTTWVSCIWRGDHSRVTPFLTTGTKVFVRGDAALKLYIGHDGQKHAGLNIRVQELELCGSRSDNNNPGLTYTSNVAPATAGAHQDASQADGNSDEQLAF